MTITEIMERIQQEHGGESTASSLTEPKQYKCETCLDTGWVRFEKDGYTFCRECECVKARKAEALMKKSGLAGVLAEQTFDSFTVSNSVQNTMKVMGKNYLNALFSIPSDAARKPWLYIGGNPGCGKTHICTAICGELLKNNVEVVYMQWLDEVRRLKAYVNDPDFENMVDKYTDCAVLYIDDLFKQTYHGTPILTDADVKIAFTIFNARYLQSKPTIISSEWDLETLLEADEGVFSRVYERCKGYTFSVPRDVKYNYRLARLRGQTA